MVSTRHHPKPFPPPPEPTSPKSTSHRIPETPTSTTSSRTISDSPANPISPTLRSRSRSQSRKTKSQTVSPKDEDKIASLKSGLTRSSPKQKQLLLRSTSTRQRPSTSTSTYDHTPPPFLILWLIISLPLVLWDTGYILFRPHSMPGGKYHYPIWRPYELYGRIDYIYGALAWDTHNGFTAAQGTMNLLETACYIYYLLVIANRVASGDGFVRGVALKSFNVFARRDDKERDKIVVSGGADVAGAVVLLFVTLVLTWAKTVLYALNEYYSDWKHVRHNFEDPMRLVVLWILPNSPWIVVPGILGWIVGKEIIEAMCTGKGGGRERVVEEGGKERKS